MAGVATSQCARAGVMPAATTDHSSQITDQLFHHGLGRGYGVGLGLGIGVPLGVGVGRGVEVGVAVGVTLAVGVGVGPTSPQNPDTFIV